MKTLNSAEEAHEFLASIFENSEEMGISSAEERQDFFQNLIIKNIPFESTAEELLEALKVPDSLISSFKLHRGYAFLTLSQAHPISVDVTLKDRKLIIENIKEEWMCACGMNNYDTRSECLSCGVSRFNRGDGDVSDIPTEYIILRNLSPTTSSQDIYTTLDGHEIVNVIVITDKSTRESWCFAFLRFDTVLPATKLLKFYKQSDLVIDNQVVDLDYASLSTFLPGMITGFTSFIKQDIGYSYWDGKAFGSSFPLSDSIPPPPSIQDYLDTITIKVKEKKQTFIGPAITSRQQRQVTNWKSTDIDFTNDSNVDFELKVAVDKLVPSTSAIDQEFSDLVRVACMLCRRGFKKRGGESGLRRHLEESLMHAQKVRLCKKSRREEIEASIKNGEIKLQERIFTAPEPIQKTVQVTRHGIKADNIGNRMLKMMGWKEGKGLGVNEDGRRENIKVEVDNSRKGIGARTAIKKNSSTKVKFKIHKK